MFFVPSLWKQQLRSGCSFLSCLLNLPILGIFYELDNRFGCCMKTLTSYGYLDNGRQDVCLGERWWVWFCAIWQQEEKMKPLLQNQKIFVVHIRTCCHWHTGEDGQGSPAQWLGSWVYRFILFEMLDNSKNYVSYTIMLLRIFFDK